MVTTSLGTMHYALLVRSCLPVPTHFGSPEATRIWSRSGTQRHILPWVATRDPVKLSRYHHGHARPSNLTLTPVCRHSITLATEEPSYASRELFLMSCAYFRPRLALPAAVPCQLPRLRDPANFSAPSAPPHHKDLSANISFVVCIPVVVCPGYSVKTGPTRLWRCGSPARTIALDLNIDQKLAGICPAEFLNRRHFSSSQLLYRSKRSVLSLFRHRRRGHAHAHAHTDGYRCETSILSCSTGLITG
ncbi:hypothetical protein L227DRAFT_383356 [Lentinus tigrinus ALCF2SS1-6]|uniref:Uncharacterized protein n=1 Tax=Lentinus tigrinus ALCF2SS1-6 TaxID=1328759 RepID=A0A5C2RPT8_9APHY|nr:hypothetical protein L227DRAFT_383356 [Lentinus tigrinus ALCF2SS1-6]